MARLKRLLCCDKPLVMGILNVTPDSFSDGGKYTTLDRALAHALDMVEDGADIIDIGGESTRPGAEGISFQEEIDRVIPIIKALRQESNVAISLDSSKAEVLRAAKSEDIDLVNDVRALREEGVLEEVMQSDLPICLMHMQGEPRTMQGNPIYTNVVEEVFQFFQERVNVCYQAGIERSRLILDIGFGFGKNLEDNLVLVNRLPTFLELGLPLLVGMSRKSTITKIARDPISGSVSAALFALNKGARILRVHDVAQTMAAVEVWQSFMAERLINLDV